MKAADDRPSDVLLVEGVDRRVARTWPVRVAKVGRKYFYVETLDPKDSWVCVGMRFDIATGKAAVPPGWRVEGPYTAGWRVRALK